MVRMQRLKGFVLVTTGRIVCATVMLSLLAGCVVYNKEGEVDQEATANLNKSITDGFSAFTSAAASATSAYLKAREEAKQARRCPHCGGQGWVACPACKGHGHFVCNVCRGRGCFRCSGYGRFRCNTCGGAGRVRCQH